MSEAAIKNTVMTMMFGVIFLGGAAALLGIYRAAQETKQLPGFVVQESDGVMFVYGANA